VRSFEKALYNDLSQMIVTFEKSVNFQFKCDVNNYVQQFQNFPEFRQRLGKVKPKHRQPVWQIVEQRRKRRKQSKQVNPFLLFKLGKSVIHIFVTEKDADLKV
jgi:hypothetical protein